MSDDRDIGARLAEVCERIAVAAKQAGRDPHDVQLVAVSKNVEPERIAAVVDAGQHVLGENRAQELLAHAGSLHRDDIEWHFIGRLQRNKVRSLVDVVTLWQSVDDDVLVAEIAKRAPGARVLLQVNVAREAQKGGCEPDAVPALADSARSAGLRVEGLMTVPPLEADPRPWFAMLRAIGAKLELPQLSMGMSGDYEAAVAEGATIVRVGTSIFGPRPKPADMRR
jgi:pyridoxal phosphate enzyme (YggS family)